MARQSVRTRGHRKREKTRSQLVAAGLAVLAEKGEALTVSDVVGAADVSVGTFYNYFPDRDALFDALAEHLVLSLAAAAAIGTSSTDSAMRFAIATARVLERAREDPTWGRVVLRLVDLRASVRLDVVRYLRDDLVAGFESGRFDVGDDDATLDQVVGLVSTAIRRIVTGEAEAGYPQRALARALFALGISRDEATRLAAEALGD